MNPSSSTQHRQGAQRAAKCVKEVLDSLRHMCRERRRDSGGRSRHFENLKRTMVIHSRRGAPMQHGRRKMGYQEEKRARRHAKASLAEVAIAPTF